MDDGEQERLRELGGRVRLLRETRELTVEQLAAAAGVARAAVESVESGDHPATVLAVWRVADALGIPVAELLEPPR